MYHKTDGYCYNKADGKCHWTGGYLNEAGGPWDLAYLFVVLFQQSGGQVCCSTQLILKEKTSDSTE